MPVKGTAAPSARRGDGYRLPRIIDVRLSAAVMGLRNVEAVMRLAVFLARFHTAPGRLGRTFPVDRIALAGHGELNLSEARVRGALAALERVGFLERQEVPGSAYRLTAQGLHRKPVLWKFGSVFGLLFEKANTAALAARGARSSARRPIVPAVAPRPPLSPPVARPAPLLARKDPPAVSVSSGDQNRAGPESGLEAALARLRKVVTDDAA